VSALIDLVLRYGDAALLSYVLVSQLGAPLPTPPLLLAAGALAVTAHVSVAHIVFDVVLASVCADSLWYYLGRARGGAVLRLLCRISLEPMSCVRITDGFVARHGFGFLLISKFLPGIGMLAPPAMGHAKSSYGRFLVFDAAGAALWGFTYTGVGSFLGRGIPRSSLKWTGLFVGLLFVSGLLAAVVAKASRHRKREGSPLEARGNLLRHALRWLHR
jgi:membrane protein DedA with SNARE-associated domain